MNALVGVPPAAIVRTLSRFDRDQLAGFIAVAIDLLDFADGDPDAEEIGLEDSFQAHSPYRPGCALADGESDVAWAEWDRRRGDRLTALPAPLPADVNGYLASEDDDPSGQCDEDGVNTCIDVFFERRGAGCTISDDDAAPDDNGEPVR